MKYEEQGRPRYRLAAGAAVLGLLPAAGIAEAYVTAALRPTLITYQWTDPIGTSLSDGMVFGMDLIKIDHNAVRRRPNKAIAHAG